MWSLGLWASLVGVALSTDSLGAVMALTGAVAGSLIGFILPGLIFSSPVVLVEINAVCRRLRRWR